MPTALAVPPGIAPPEVEESEAAVVPGVPEMPFHELSGIFPMMDDPALDELAESIRQHGLQVPICTYKGSILDGRNRYRAARKAGFRLDSYHWREYLGEDPLGFVVSQNLDRRHLTTDQRVQIGLKLVEMYKEAAAQRMKAGTLAPNGAKVSEQVAVAVNVSSRTLERAIEVERKAPDLAEQVQAGTLSGSQAHKQLKDRESSQAIDPDDPLNDLEPELLFEPAPVPDTACWRATSRR